MTSLFKPPTVAAPVSSSAAAPPKPRVTRMPTETDPDIVAAGRRTRRAAMQRKGRQSTILTDRTNDTIGSSGQRLGA